MMSVATADKLAPTVDGRRRFTVDDYYRMAEAGILRADERVELLDGEIVDMVPIGPAHGGCVKRLNLHFRQLGDRAIPAVQDPVRLSATSEPEPDFMLLRPREDIYADSHPTPADVLLLVEVAGASLERDQRVKLPLYAKAGIPEVWLIDLSDRSITVHRQPSARGFDRIARQTGEAVVACEAFPELEATVNELVPAASK
jgi:Uma2 family endonuclease